MSNATTTKPKTEGNRRRSVWRLRGAVRTETLIPALDELTAAYAAATADVAYKRELDDMLVNYVGRPSPLSTGAAFFEGSGHDRVAQAGGSQSH